MEMLANRIRTRGTHPHAALFVCGAAIVLSACGTTAAQQSAAGPESHDLQPAGAISAGAFSLDYETAQHIGNVNTGAGSFSLDYDTARHLGQVHTGAGAFSLDYDTVRHIGWLPKAGE
jgi:hypothetical protein